MSGYKIAVTLGDTISTGKVYVSQDSGITWSENAPPAGAFSPYNITATSDGSFMAVAQYISYLNLPISASTDGGTNFSDTAGGNGFSNVISSNNGDCIIGYTGTNVYKSTDQCASWADLGITSTNFSAADFSGNSGGDNNTIIVADTGNLYLSYDGGSNWTINSTFPIGIATNFTSVACSADGSKMVATSSDPSTGAIIYSHNGGTNWILANTSGANNYKTLANSNSCVTMYCSTNNDILKSIDYGVNWTVIYTIPEGAMSLSCSQDGTFVTAISAQYVYTSSDSGSNWTQQSLQGYNFFKDVIVYGDPVIQVNSIQATPTSITNLQAGTAQSIAIDVLPLDAPNRTFSISSADTNIVLADYIYIPFNNSVTDISGNSTLTTTGSITYTSDATRSYAGVFSNSAGGTAVNYVRGTCIMDRDFSISFWFNQQNYPPDGTNSTMFMLGTNTQPVFQIVYISLGAYTGFKVQYRDATNTLATMFSIPVINNNTWYKVGVNVQSLGTCTLYINDNLDQTTIGTGIFIEPTLFSIGSTTFDTSSAYDGYISDLTISNPYMLNSNGVVIGVVPGGPVDVTITANDGSGVSTIVPVTVIGVPVSSISSSPSSVTNLHVGGTQQLTPTVLPANAGNKSVSYSSADTNIATVDSNGLVTGVAIGGPINITISANDGSGVTTTVPVTVIATPVTSISASPSSITSLTVAGTRQITPTVLPADATNKAVTYSSADTNIATVTSGGLVTGVAVGGPINITISATDGSGVTTTVPVTVVSSSGLYKIAASYANGRGNSNVRVSDDSGASWTTSTADSSLAARSITSTSNGSFMAVASYNTNIYTSTDSGSTFTPSSAGYNYWNVVSNGDGSFLVGYTVTNIYKSTDNGANWVDLAGPSNNWTAVDVSKIAGASGYTIVAADQANIYVSTDSGANWVTYNSFPAGFSTNFISVTCSEDGTKMAACSYDVSSGAIFYSTDSGTNWSLGNTTAYGLFKSIASSNDGTTLFCCQQNAGIWKSTDSGAYWSFTSLSKFWVNIDCSSDGTFAAAVASSANIYTYSDGGSWTEQVSSGGNSWTDITVYKSIISVTSISSSPNSITNLHVTGTQQLTPTVLPANATNKAVTYSSANTGIATVDSNGLVTGVAIGGPINITITAADGSGVTTTVPVTVIATPVTSISSSPSSITNLHVAGTQQLTPTVLPADATNKAVSYSSANNSIATVDGAGLVTGVAIGGPINITITAADGSGVTTTVPVTVIATPVTSISSSPSSITNLHVAGTQQLTPTVLPANATNKAVTYSSADTSIATVDSNGLVTGVAIGGPVNITITAADGSGVTTTVPVTVIATPVTSISSSPSTITLEVSRTQQITPTVLPANATNKAVTYSSANTGIALVDGAGLVTGVAIGGPINITISATDGSGVTTTVPVTIVAAPANPVTSISSSPSSITNLHIAGTQQLTPTVLPANATNPTVSYSSADTSIATVSPTGLVTGVALGGPINIIISATDGSGVTANVPVTVVAIPVTSISSSPSSITNLHVTGTQQLTPTVLPADATNKAVSYSSADTSIATVTSGGLVTGVAIGGPINITISATDGSGVTTTVPVTVIATQVTSINPSPASMTIEVSRTQQITPTVLPANATNKAVNYSSADTSIALVDGSGLVTGVAIGGPVNITISATDGSGVTATVPVTVVSPPANPVTSISASPSGISNLHVNGTQLITPTVLPANATNKAVNYSSADTSIALVDGSGLVTGVAIGGPINITISATDGSGVTTTVPVTVIATPVTSISSSPSSITNLQVSGTQQLTPTVLPADATNKAVTYSSANSGIATVTSGGLVTGVSVGGPINITISANDGSGVTTTVPVTVINNTSTYNIAACVNSGYIYTTSNSGVTWTQQTGSTSQTWSCVAASSNGSKLVSCVNPGGIYTSSNSGVTWSNANNAPTPVAWKSVTSSSNGNKLAACVYGGSIYTSTDSGATWTQRGTVRNWNAITCSSDGTKLAAVDFNGYIYTSTDSGVSWTERTGSTTKYWTCITSSSDGTKLAAGTTSNLIFTSTDSGVTWTGQSSSTTQNWRSIAGSSDGSKLVSCYINGNIVTSGDSGVTWTEQLSSGYKRWNHVVMSSDGTFIAGSVENDAIYTSSDSGVNWAASASGSQLWSGLFLAAPPVCVLGETEILMADGSVKMIKDIKRGDLVMTDKKTRSYKKVCRVVNTVYSGKVVRIYKDLLGNRKPIILTSGHPIWINGDKNRICARDVYRRQLVEVCEIFYNIQYEEEGTYYANDVKMDSLSPNNHQFKLPKELYFEQSKYNRELIIKTEDDPRRGKPKMIDKYIERGNKNL